MEAARGSGLPFVFGASAIVGYRAKPSAIATALRMAMDLLIVS
jgi:hypothetical protein